MEIKSVTLFISFYCSKNCLLGRTLNVRMYIDSRTLNVYQAVEDKVQEDKRFMTHVMRYLF